MISKLIKKYIDGNNKSAVNIVFILYAVFLCLFVFTYVLILRKDISYFLSDDGYYVMGKYLFEGKITLSHQLRSPGILFWFSYFNYFPDVFHPYLRLLLTIALTYGNLYLASRIFENILTKKQMLIGLFISVFNPVHLHFTIKSTPEIYLAFFIGLIILFYKKYLFESKKRYLFFTIFIVLIGMTFKPVFFLIPFFLLIHSVLIKNIRKLLIPLVSFSLISVVIFFISSSYTKPLNNETNFIMLESIIVPTFLPDAIMRTKELNLGTKEEYLMEKQDKSNYFICMEYYEKYLFEYKQRNADLTESAIVLDFIKNNFFKFFLVKIVSPVTFISLSSSTAETILNFFLNISLITISIVSIKKVYKKNKSDVLAIVFILLGYAFVFFLSSCYIRYSLPFLSYFFPFSGILICSAMEKMFNKKIQEDLKISR